jgi:hypothetical protein
MITGWDIVMYSSSVATAFILAQFHYMTNSFVVLFSTLNTVKINLTFKGQTEAHDGAIG